MKEGILEAFSRIPIYSSLNRINRGKGIILVYHRVKEPAAFEKQIAFISQNYMVMPLDALVSLIIKSEPFPEHSLSITFDDGYRNIYHNGYPVLAKYKCAATVFLNTGLIGRDKPIWPVWVYEYIFQSTQAIIDVEFGQRKLRLDISNPKAKQKAYHILVNLLKHEFQANLWFNLDQLWKATGQPEITWKEDDLILTWEQIKEMEESNWFKFGNHTDSHRILPWVDASTQATEIDRAGEKLQTQLSCPSQVFAFPNGEYNTNVIRYLENKGYRGAVTIHERLVTFHSDPMRLERLGVNDNEDVSLLKLRLSGAVGFTKMFFKTAP